MYIPYIVIFYTRKEEIDICEHQSDKIGNGKDLLQKKNKASQSFHYSKLRNNTL